MSPQHERSTEPTSGARSNAHAEWLQIFAKFGLGLKNQKLGGEDSNLDRGNQNPLSYH